MKLTYEIDPQRHEEIKQMAETLEDVLEFDCEYNLHSEEGMVIEHVAAESIQTHTCFWNDSNEVTLIAEFCVCGETEYRWSDKHFSRFRIELVYEDDIFNASESHVETYPCCIMGPFDYRSDSFIEEFIYSRIETTPHGHTQWGMTDETPSRLTI